MRFSPTFLDEIRDRVPISSVIGARVSWDRRKTNAPKGDYWACCPFHGEKSPSFHCEDRKGRYHCFGCGVSGDHFRFLTELDGLSFPEAVERIADLAGVAMPARDEQEERREKQRASLTDVMEMATIFFQERLQGSDGARARAYLRDRGLTPATQQSFRLGYAPDSRNALKEYLAAKGVAKEQMEACGLTVFEDVPVSYDRFRDRIMFPIPDSRGRIIAFGGRAMSPDVAAKYLNSPETELFHKGNVLYNFARARKALGRPGPNGAGTVVAVEGYMDVIALAQAGFENVVAPLGTALTENQMELLWRMAGEPVLCFDGDQAGLKAAWRAADLVLPAIQPGRTARFALLPEGKDPDDLVRDDGPDAFRAVLAEARPLAELLWMRETTGGVFDTPERRAELERRLREITSRIRDESVRFHYQQDMRERALAFFAPSQRRKGWKERYQKKGVRDEPIGETESLVRWRQKMGRVDIPIRRDKFFVSLVVNHPDLLDEFYDEFEKAPIKGINETQLRMVILQAYGDGRSIEKASVRHWVLKSDLGEYFEKVERELLQLGDWQVAVASDICDVAEAFVNMLDLYQEFEKERRNSASLEELWLSLIEAGDIESSAKLMVAQSEEVSSKRRAQAGDENTGRASGRKSKS